MYNLGLTNMPSIDLQFIDHIAIRVKDLKVSQKWYIDVLGFAPKSYPEWGDYPIFLTSGQFAVALFPAYLDDPPLSSSSRQVKIDHFAFRVDEENFRKALIHFSDLKIPFQVQDHYYYESVYISDPDGHCLELTREVDKKITKNDFTS
jgi:catechol-2,3-dioxygenase